MAAQISEKKKEVVYAILEFLKDTLAEGVAYAESIEVAIQCLNEAFGFDSDNAEQRAKYSSKPLGLEDIFSAGKAVLKAQASGQESEAQSEEFLKFLESLKAKGFFAHTAEGTADYQERVKRAKAKWDERFSSQAAPKAEDDGKKKQAEELKNKANSKVSAKEYDEAIKLYSEAIALCPDNAVYYANRAAAYSHKKDHQSAVADCEKSIGLNASYSKAYSRLGHALFSLGKYKEAIERGYAKALQLEPANTTFLTNLQEAQAKLTGVAKPAATATPAAAPGGGFDMSKLNDLFSNPAMMDMASKLSQSPNVQNMMTNPAFQNMLSGMMGSGAGGAGGAPAAGGMPDLSSMFNPASLSNLTSQLESNPNIAKLKENPKMQAIMEDIKTNGMSAMFKYMNDPEVMDIVAKLGETVLGSFGAPAAAGPNPRNDRADPSGGAPPGASSSVYSVD